MPNVRRLAVLNGQTGENGMKNQPPFKAKITLRLGLVVLAMAIVALASPESRQASSGGEQEKRVREFVEAFNARKVDVMLELTAENIQWMIIDGAKVSIETEGKGALRESMERYFSSCSSCRSSLEWVQIAGSRVTAMERASWSGNDGAKSQRSLSVYEFRGGKILRVYYFPAEAVTFPPQAK
jgi:hypothetical protein